MIENAFRERKIEIKYKDPNKKIQNKIVILMKERKCQKILYHHAFNHALNTPRAFRRYKDNKVPLSIRPIINEKEGPTYFLEKYMMKIYIFFLTVIIV